MEHSIDLYNRQEDLISPPDVVHIVGCGGVGTWAAIMLAMAGVPHLHLYEDDTVEESNLNRLPYSPKAVGEAKMDCLTAWLRGLRPGIELTLHGKFQPLLHKFSSSDRVIGAVDTMRDRQQIYAACQEARAYYVDVGAESHHCTVSDSPAEWSFVEDRPGYFTPIWVAPVCMAASLAVAAVMYGNIGQGQTVAFDLRHMRREPHQEAPAPVRPFYEQTLTGRFIGIDVASLDPERLTERTPTIHEQEEQEPRRAVVGEQAAGAPAGEGDVHSYSSPVPTADPRVNAAVNAAPDRIRRRAHGQR